MNFYYPTGLPFHNIGVLDWIYRRGGIFVEMFLVVSGFTSFYAYANKIDAGMTFPQFAVRRAVRIYPLMWATLLTALLLHMVYFLQNGHTFWLGGEQTLTTLIFGFLGLQAVFPGAQSWNFPAWSLSVFFLCWIVFYGIVHFTRKREDVRILCCIAVIVLGIGLCRNPLPTQVVFLNSSMARGYISFFSGGLLFYIQRATEGCKRKSIFCAVLILCGLAVLHILGVPTGQHTIVFGMIIFPCILLLCLQSRILNRILSFPPVTFFGKISFSIYLCNTPMELLTALLDRNLGLGINYSSGAFFFGNMVAQTVVASIFWKLFEDVMPRMLKARCLKGAK